MSGAPCPPAGSLPQKCSGNCSGHHSPPLAGRVLPWEAELSWSLMSISGDKGKGSWSSLSEAPLWRQRHELMRSLFFCTK